MSTEHSHVMGGSTAPQRVNCPGSYHAERDAPPKPVSEFAVQGSVFHAAMELLLTDDPRNMDDANPLFDALVGQDLGFGEEWQITEEQIQEKIAPALETWFELCNEYEFDDWFIEQRVSLDTVIGGAFGTADVIAKDGKGRLHIIDWKFGDGVPVPAEGNLSLLFYAAATLYDEEPELTEFCETITGVVLHIVQPRVGDDEVRHTWETTEAIVEEFVETAIRSMDMAMLADAPLKAGDWCKWCAAKLTCPAQQALTTEVISKQPDGMTAIELAALIKAAILAKDRIAEIFDYAQRQLEGGVQIPGFKLVNKRPRRIWTDPTTVEALLKKKKKPIAKTHTRELRSPTQLEKEFGKEFYSEVLADLVQKKSSGLTLVEDADKRPAVVNSVELLTNALPDQQTGNRKQEQGK